MAIYQFGIYLLLLSTVNLLFSGMANFFKELLFNPSLLQGFMLAMVLSVLFLLAGWLLTRRRPI
ncbi:hypothetical protein ACSNN5_19625 [Brevibacillus formosus]